MGRIVDVNGFMGDLPGLSLLKGGLRAVCCFFLLSDRIGLISFRFQEIGHRFFFLALPHSRERTCVMDSNAVGGVSTIHKRSLVESNLRVTDESISGTSIQLDGLDVPSEPSGFSRNSSLRRCKETRRKDGRCVEETW